MRGEAAGRGIELSKGYHAHANRTHTTTLKHSCLRPNKSLFLSPSKQNSQIEIQPPKAASPSKNTEQKRRGGEKTNRKILVMAIILLSATLLVSPLIGTVGLVLLTDAVVYAQNNIPSSIVEKSNQFIISKVGQDFFNKYIRINYNHCKYYTPDEYIIQHPEGSADFLQRPYYLMVYSFKMPEKPFVDELIEFAVDADGNVILERNVYGIPDLINNPSEGNFPIDEAGAIQIARNAGLEDGIAGWETSFHWYAGDLKTYVWTVQNTLPTPPGQGYSAYGKVVVIDANSGEVIQTGEWGTVPEERPTSNTLNVTIIFLYISIAIVILILPFTIWRIFKRKK